MMPEQNGHFLHSETSSLRRLAPLFAAGIGLVATLGLFFLVRSWETHRLLSSFERAAADHVAAISRGIEHSLEDVETLWGLFAASREVERGEFHNFVRQLHTGSERGSDYTQAWEWIPRVTHRERQAYEAAARADGLTGYRITERQTQGVMVPAARREEYFPVFYLEPLAGNEPALGFDLASNPVRMAAMKRSLERAEMTVTARITLVQERGQQYGFLAFRPVYRKNAPLDSVEDRQHALLGFALGVFRIGELLENSMTYLEPQGIDIYLYDASAPADEQRLAFLPAPTRPSPTELQPATDAELKKGLHFERLLTVADRQWRILCTPTPGYLATAQNGGAWVVLAAGLLTTTLLSGYFRLILQRAEQIRHHAAELTRANESLEQEVAVRLQGEEMLRHLAYFDPLTDLPNRTLLYDRLSQTLLDADRRNTELAVLFLDLDNFKDINDSFGHPIGDRVLIEASQRLAATLRKSDTLARMGGDEFVILMGGLSQPEHSLQLIRKLHTAFEAPFSLAEGDIYATISIGVALYPGDGSGADELLKNADIALFQAKSQGRNRSHYFSSEMDRCVRERLVLHTELRQALEREEFIPYYQPKVDLRSGEIDGVEVLVRWRHPQRGIVSPGSFIPLAEETGLIIPLGEKVFEMACFQAQTWQNEGIPPLHLAINLSTVQLRRPDLVGSLGGILQKSGLDPHWLELEITESAIMHDPEKAAETLQGLKSLGIPHITMDDFGTGYSSLNYLKRFPVSVLKIDYSFIKDIPDNPEACVLVKTIITLAKNLNLKIIAEGVENKEQVRFLQQHGCDAAQGFFFFKPMPGEEMQKILEKRSKGTELAAFEEFEGHPAH